MLLNDLHTVRPHDADATQVKRSMLLRGVARPGMACQLLGQRCHARTHDEWFRHGTRRSDVVEERERIRKRGAVQRRRPIWSQRPAVYRQREHVAERLMPETRYRRCGNGIDDNRAHVVVNAIRRDLDHELDWQRATDHRAPRHRALHGVVVVLDEPYAVMLDAVPLEL